VTTVISRTVRSVPFRSASDTWQLMIDILTAAGGSVHRAELVSVSGIASALIAEKTAQDAPIILMGGGPRVRLYTLFDDAALEGESGNETPLSFDPFKGDWKLSFSCPDEDLDWVRAALVDKSKRVTARTASESIVVSVSKSLPTAIELDVAGFMKL
jgi:hypothetical protein